MYGAFIGDINGSKYEFNNTHDYNLKLFEDDMRYTDDSVLTLAIMDTFNNFYGVDDDVFKDKLITKLIDFTNNDSRRGFGNMFYSWVNNYVHLPYNSCGNGSGMRVSSVAYVSKKLDEVKKYSKLVTEVTHNHPEGIKGAEAIAVAIFLAKNKTPINEIKDYIVKNYYPRILDMDYEDLKKNYYFKATCQESCPEAIFCFLISTSFEDALRKAITIGGDSDTIADMTCAIAEAYYGVSEEFKEKTREYLPKRYLEIIDKFVEKFINNNN